MAKQPQQDTRQLPDPRLVPTYYVVTADWILSYGADCAPSFCALLTCPTPTPLPCRPLARPYGRSSGLLSLLV